MPEYTAPGVYVEEIERGPRSIEGVPTSTAAFVGETERGPIWPKLITSYAEYLRFFGGACGAGKYLPDAANGFFANGGAQLYVARVVGRHAVAASRAFGTVTLRAIGPGCWGNRIFASVAPSTSTDEHGNAGGFRLRVAYWSTLPDGFEPYDPFAGVNPAGSPPPAIAEEFDDLSADPASANFYEKRLGTAVAPKSALAWLDGGGAPAGTRPADGDWEALAGGSDGDAPPDAYDFVGAVEPGVRDAAQGLAALEHDAFRDVALLHVPYPAGDANAIHRETIAHCERNRFRFAVLDCDPHANPADVNPRDTIPADTSYAAIYYPWVVAPEPESGAAATVPPCGFVLGVYARTDAARGVFKAPANEALAGVVRLERTITHAEQDVLVPRGLNAIREFPGRGVVVWGARTLTSDGLWKYVNVRRLFIFLERSICQGTQWVAFEPNGEPLWAAVRGAIQSFLLLQWRTGALHGAKPEEAFYVRCDRTTMTQDDIANGRLICEIGVAPLRPAEFVIFRLFQWTMEAQGSTAAAAARPDPFRDFRFRLEIDGVPVAEFGEIAVEESGAEGDEAPDALARVRKLLGLRKQVTITLKRGFTASRALGDAPSRALGDWREAIAGAAGLRRQVTIVVVDEHGNRRARFTAGTALPAKVDPADLNARGNEVVIEVIEIAHEGLKLEDD